MKLINSFYNYFFTKRAFYTFAHLKRRPNDEKNKQKMQKFG